MTSKNAFWRQSDSSRSGRDGVIGVKRTFVRGGVQWIGSYSPTRELPDEAQLDVRRKCLMQRLMIVSAFRLVRRGTSK